MAILLSPARRVLLLFVLPTAVGCGVGDYENKMEAAQKRVLRWEEMTRLLDAPLTMPTQTNKDNTVTPLVILFLRPPKGISSRATNEKEPRERMMYTFEQPHQPTLAFPFVEIAFAPVKTNDFESRVLACYPTTSGQSTRRTRQVEDPGRPPMTFSSVEFDEGVYSFSVNFYKGSQTQAAVAYRLLKASKSLATPAVNLSLETFGLDADANRAQANQAGQPLVVPKHPK